MTSHTANPTVSPNDKSVITCDLEGRIETFGEGAAQLFGYAPDEVIGKKRVSLFSPGLTVLEHVPRWLATSVKEGAFETDTVFVRKDGTEVPAHIRITPTFKGGKGGTQIGYCGVTTPLPMEKLEAVRPRISLGTRIFAALVITRAPFLTATLAPVFIALGAAFSFGLPVSWLGFALAAVGAVALHVAANTFNDAFDWESGADKLNNDYFMPFSGGSRSIELGLISVRGLKALATVALLVGALCGGALMLQGSATELLALGVVGAFAVYFYTAPPIRLAARRGLGELFVGLCFGPLMTAGTMVATTGVLDARAFWVGIPVGLLVTAILWINEIPDAKSDALAGKNHLVVTLGLRGAKLGYMALIGGAALAHGALVVAGVLPLVSVVALAPLAFGARAVRALWASTSERGVIGANRDTIVAHALYGVVLTLALAFG